MAPIRRGGLAAVLPMSANAGTMPSSHGNASDAPRPRRTVRRDRCFLVIILMSLATPSSELRRRAVDGHVWLLRLRDPHSKWRAVDQPQNQGRPSVVTGRRVPDDPADGWL